jgi:hypothetical protein
MVAACSSQPPPTKTNHLPLQTAVPENFPQSNDSAPNDNASKQTDDFELVLPNEIAETSGLVCLDHDRFLTVNDSGHSPVVFELDIRNQILQKYEKYQLNATNNDWEAMTLHEGQLWIGDIGNNRGLRHGGELYQVALPLHTTSSGVHRNNPKAKASNTLATRSSSFTYPNFPQVALQAYQHDYDAEALVSANGQLFLVNKAWQSEQTNVLRLIPDTTAMQARVVAKINGLPGVITDAAFSEQHQHFVMTGYARFRDNALQLALFDHYQPFLAVLDAQFQLVKVVLIRQGGQLEGICIDSQQQIWLTQEQSKRRPALLWRWGTLQQLLSTATTDEKSSQIN